MLHSTDAQTPGDGAWAGKEEDLTNNQISRHEKTRQTARPERASTAVAKRQRESKSDRERAERR